MAVFKRGKYWQYDFRFEGIRFQKSTKQRDKREAEKIENAVKTDLARRKFNLPSKSVRFRELCKRYSEFAKTNGKRAYAVEKYHIAKHLVPHFGEILVHAINLDLCEKYKRQRLKAGVKEATINREFSTLKAILKYAGQSGLAPEGLGRFARMFTNVESGEGRALQPDEIEKLLNACASLEFQAITPYLFPLVIVATYTGLRPSEYRMLLKTDLDMAHRVISARKSKTRSGVRHIPMRAEVFEILSRWLPTVEGPWVFPSPRIAGAPIQDFGKAFAKAVEKAGLVDVTPYSLRHTFATELDAIASRAVVAKLMGHAREQNTKPYLHPDWTRKVEAIEMLPVPANFTTVLESWKPGPEVDEGQVPVPEELVMVGPWGLEPQTSTVSR
jgi:integrase